MGAETGDASLYDFKKPNIGFYHRYIEKVHMPSRKSTLVAVGILHHEGRIALIQFKRNVLAGFWGLPGGKIDLGESLPQAVIREFKEETNIDVSFGSMLAVLDEEITSKDGVDYYTMFICDVNPAESVSMDRSENEEGVVDWFTPDEIINKEIPMVSSDYEVLTRVALNQTRGYIFSQMDITKAPIELNRFEVN